MILSIHPIHYITPSIEHFYKGQPVIYVPAIDEQSLQMQSPVKQIHNRLLSQMRPNDDVKTFITKKFLRAYTENQLEKQSFAKELCTPKDMEILTKTIQQRFSSIFRANGNIYKRSNKHFIYGIQLSKDLAAAEARFRMNQQQHRDRDGEQKLTPSRVTLVCDDDEGIKDEEDNENVFEEQEQSERAYSRVTNTKSNILKQSKARTDIGSRLKSAFHSSNKSPREYQLQRKARELQEQNRELHQIVSYLMKKVVEMADMDRRLQQQRSIDIDQPVLSSRAKRELRSLL